MSNININALVTALVEADAAVKELPELRERLAQADRIQEAQQDTIISLESELSAFDEKYSQAQSRIAALEAEVATLEDKLSSSEAKSESLIQQVLDRDALISSLEAELASVKFRADTAESRIAAVLVALGNPDNSVHTPPHSPEEVIPVTDEVTPPACPADPIEPPLLPAADLTPSGQSDTDPTALAQGMELSSPPNADSDTASDNADVNGQSSPQPLPICDTHSPDGSDTDHTSIPETSDTPASPAQQSTWVPIDYHSTAKPDSMLWGEWLAAGGPAPYWMDEAEANWHKEQHRKGIAHLAAE
jgi:hypothetical protein